MTRAHINLLSSGISLSGALILLIALRTPSAFIWLAASVVWLIMAILGQRKSEELQSPGRRILRRFSRLLLVS
jgi:hypothetical protein